MAHPRRIGVLGGTFDPVHLGHLVVASEIHHALELDVVLFVPAGRPWQKADRTVTSAEHRTRMVELAVADDERFAVSTVDVDRPGPTYSIDTVRDLRLQYGPDAEFRLITGMDALAGLSTWHEVRALLNEATVVACERPGHVAAMPEGFTDRQVLFVPTTRLDVSSTEIRRRVGVAEPVRYLVPSGVERYIDAHGLYRDAA